MNLKNITSRNNPISLSGVLSQEHIEPVMDIDCFIGHLFYVRNMIHLYHLNASGVGSYAKHVALNDAYDGLLDIIDTLAETAQVESLLKICVPEAELTSLDAKTFLVEELTWVRNNRFVFPYSFQQNIVDTIEELYSKTIYKLTFLS